MAMTPTVTMTTPRTSPKAPPRNRSIQRSPTSRIALRTIRAIIPATRTTAKKIVKKPARSAIAGDFTYGKNQEAICQYPQAASRKPITVPAREKISKKKPWTAASQTETSMTPKMAQSSPFMRSGSAYSAGNSRPARILYAWMYFSLVFWATSSGRGGAGGCLFHRITSK